LFGLIPKPIPGEPEKRVYNRNSGDFLLERFLGTFRPSIQRRTVSQAPTRKQFLAKLVGLSAAAVAAPRLVSAVASSSSKSSASPTVSFQVRPQPRAVARRDGTV
jgi:hypothetical protein